MMFRTAMVSLLLPLAVLASAALLALESAEEFPADWGCDADPKHDFDLVCGPFCEYSDRTREVFGFQSIWHCPGSNVRHNCAERFCKTEEACRKYGLPYRPCHDLEKWVCKARAIRATQFACKVKGPPGTAVKVGDCVLRIVRYPSWISDATQITMDCWNPSDYAFAPDSWKPAHPETLVRHPPPRPPRPPDYKPLE